LRRRAARPAEREHEQAPAEESPRTPEPTPTQRDS
jgi:hypothetical protein